MKNYFLISIFLLITSVNSFSQNIAKEMDSLKKLLAVAKNDTTRINLYLELAHRCDISENLKYAEPALALTDKRLKQKNDKKAITRLLLKRNSAIEYSKVYYETFNKKSTSFIQKLLEEQLKICEKFKDEKTMTIAILSLADHAYRSGNMLKKFEYLNYGDSQMKKYGFKKGQARFNMQLAFFYIEIGDTSQAIARAKYGQQIENEIGDTTRITRSYMLAGIFYKNIRSFPLSLVNFRECMKRGLAEKNLVALNDVCFEIGQLFSVMREYDSALHYYNKSIEYGKTIGELTRWGRPMVAKGDVYAFKGDFNKAIEIHKGLIEYCKENEIDNGATEMVENHLGQDYFLSGDYKRARPYAEKQLNRAKRSNVLIEYRDALATIYKIDSAAGNFKEAFYNHQEYMRIENGIKSDAVQKASVREKFLVDLENQKIAAKKEQAKRDAINAEEQQKQRIIIYAISGGLALVLVLVIIVLRSNRQRKKANIILEQKNHTIESQKELLEEKQKEIIDSLNYAKRIQRSQMPNEKYLEKNLSKLKK